jgi:hypothetical protein
MEWSGYCLGKNLRHQRNKKHGIHKDPDSQTNMGNEQNEAPFLCDRKVVRYPQTEKKQNP